MKKEVIKDEKQFKKIEIIMNEILKAKKKYLLFFVLIFSFNLLNAVVIFNDTFESGTLSGWGLSAVSGANNWTASSTDPFGGLWHAQSQPQSTTEPASVMEINVSTQGFNNINFSYYRRLIALDAADEFQAEWFNGTGWTILEQTGSVSADDASYLQRSFNLSNMGNNNSNLKIKFECTAGAVSEFCRVDNVTVIGDTILVNDTTPPQITISSPLNATLNTSTPRLNLTVTEPNIDRVWVSIDNGPNITYAYSNGTIDFGKLNLIFADDFGGYANGSDGSLTWTNPLSFRTAIIENKTYKLFNETAIIDALSYITNFNNLNYETNVKVMVPNGSFGGAYLTPRFGDVNNKYEIALDYDFSSININKVVNGSWSNLAALWTGNLPIPVFVGKDEWHVLGLKIYGDNISAYVDNQLALNAIDSGLRNTTGFAIIAFDDITNHTSYFDNIAINTELSSGSHTLRVWANDTFGNLNSTIVTFSVNVSDISKPVWVVEPQNQTLNETQSFQYDIEAGDNIAIDKYFINDNVNFSINQSGFIQNITVLQPLNYTLNISVNDTSNNILSKVIWINVNSIPVNLPPIIHSNLTAVNGTIKIPEFEDNFIIQVNVSDPENDTISFVNFTITSPNGTKVANNVKGINFSNGVYLIWNSTNYTVDDYGAWNWSYVLSDGTNTLNRSGNFRVFSEVFVFPASYVESPDPYNKTLIWNLSLYHLSLENYTLNFSYSINQTYFNLTIDQNSVVTNRILHTSSNFFRNLVTITTNSSTPVGSYSGYINITRQEDGRVFTIPMQIGINPPSGNIDAFNLIGVKCLNGNCDVSAQMENDESQSFNWKLKNVGNFTLSECKPGITGFNVSKFGSFSNNNFNLSISEELTLTLNMNKPTINSYYGELEVVCKATSLGFNSSLGSERENVPSLNIIVLADSGNPPSSSSSSGGGSSSSGGSSGGGGVIPVKPSLYVDSISPLVVSEGGVKKIITWKVKNNGKSFLNECKFKSLGQYSSWITYTETKGLAAGEEYNIVFDVDIPESIESGKYAMEVYFGCRETNKSTSFDVEILGKQLEFKLVNVERSGKENVKVNYFIQEVAGKDQNVNIQFILFDLDNKKVAEVSEAKDIIANSKEEFETFIPINEALSGELSLLVNINSETYSGFVQENIVLGSPIGGFAVFGGEGFSDRWISLLLVVLFLVFALFVVRRIRNRRKAVHRWSHVKKHE
ncbi:MAG: hypothetical protein AABW50_01950 [Nanoarchaeota archaeon]